LAILAAAVLFATIANFAKSLVRFSALSSLRQWLEPLAMLGKQ